MNPDTMAASTSSPVVTALDALAIRIQDLRDGIARHAEKVAPALGPECVRDIEGETAILETKTEDSPLVERLRAMTIQVRDLGNDLHELTSRVQL